MAKSKSQNNEPDTTKPNEPESSVVVPVRNKRYNTEPQYVEAAAKLLSSIVVSISTNACPPQLDDVYVIEGYKVYINVDRAELSIYERRAGLRILLIKLTDEQVLSYIKAEREYLEHASTKVEYHDLIEVANAAHRRTGFGDLLI